MLFERPSGPGAILRDITGYCYIYIYNLREFVGTHVILTPGARKWGSDLAKMTSFQVDRLDHLDHLASSRRPKSDE